MYYTIKYIPTNQIYVHAVHNYTTIFQKGEYVYKYYIILVQAFRCNCIKYQNSFKLRMQMYEKVTLQSKNHKWWTQESGSVFVNTYRLINALQMTITFNTSASSLLVATITLNAS